MLKWAVVQPAHAGLSVSHRKPVRSDRRRGRSHPPRRAGARSAAALGRARTRPQPVRVHVQDAERPHRCRHHDPVPLGGETDRAPPRPAGELHVPPGFAACDVERLAPASVADREEAQHQRLRIERPRRALDRRPLLSRRLDRACALHGRVLDADRQRLQALPCLFAGAGSRHLGPRQSRRDGAGDRSAGRPGNASGKPHRRAGGQSLSLHGVADLRRARRHRAPSRAGAVRRHAVRDAGAA